MKNNDPITLTLGVEWIVNIYHDYIGFTIRGRCFRMINGLPFVKIIMAETLLLASFYFLFLSAHQTFNVYCGVVPLGAFHFKQLKGLTRTIFASTSQKTNGEYIHFAFSKRLYYTCSFVGIKLFHMNKPSDPEAGNWWSVGQRLNPSTPPLPHSPPHISSTPIFSAPLCLFLCRHRPLTWVEHPLCCSQLSHHRLPVYVIPGLLH